MNSCKDCAWCTGTCINIHSKLYTEIVTEETPICEHFDESDLECGDCKHFDWCKKYDDCEFDSTICAKFKRCA